MKPALQLRRAVAAALGTVQDLRRASYRQALKADLTHLPNATRTLPWLLRAQFGGSILEAALRNARVAPNELALEMDDERLTWRDFADATSQVAWRLEAEGVKPGDVVAILGPNAPSYVAWVLGCTRLGATAALLNTHLEGRQLQHALKASEPRALVVETRWQETVAALEHRPRTVVYGEGALRIGSAAALDDVSAAPYPTESPDPESDFIYIYTSGTTGLPKPCRISHARALAAGAGFGILVFGFQPGDKLYNVLPLYHASGLMLGVGSCVVTRTPMALRESFSARAFFDDVQRYGATAILYIGELCRYLVNSPPTETEHDNGIRIAVGNGLRPDVWTAFQGRFDIPLIREFYGATEAPGFIFNLTGRVGSVGRVPLRRFGWLTLVRFDVESGEHIRDADGRLQECEAGEVGELLVRLASRPVSAAVEYRGYTDSEATEAKILTDVLTPGDRYFRTGDLLRRDEDDYFYFVDRIGDTFRWKGENVSTAEVADVLTAAPFVQEATVVGVPVPGHDGQAGLAALVLREAAEFDADAFATIVAELPPYARPRFVRLLPRLATTGTFKVQKGALRQDGIDPNRIDDPLYVWNQSHYEPLTPERWRQVVEGRVRL